MTILLALLGAVLAALISVVTLHSGADLLVKLVGKERCLSTTGLHGCSWWTWSTMISAAAVYWFAASYGPWALLATPLGPVLTLVCSVLSLRFSERHARKREFRIEGSRILDRNGEPLTPPYAVCGGGYQTTGPASGYCLYSISVPRAADMLATNGYVDESEYRRDLRRLLDDFGLLGWDVVVEWWPHGNECRSVCMGDYWTALMCGDLSAVSTETREFWHAVRQPGFGEFGRIDVPSNDLSLHVAELTEHVTGGSDFDRLSRDLVALRKLITQAGQSSVSVVTMAQRGRQTVTKLGPVEMSYEDGICHDRWRA